MSESDRLQDQGDEGTRPSPNERSDVGPGALPDPATSTRWRTIREWFRQASGPSGGGLEPGPGGEGDPDPELKREGETT